MSTTTIRAYRPVKVSRAKATATEYWAYTFNGPEQPTKPEGRYVYQKENEKVWRNSTGTVVEVSE